MAPGAPELALRHPRGTSRLWLGESALAAAGESLAGWLAGRRVFVVTDATVRSLHGENLGPFLASAAAVEWLEVPEGEAAKTVDEADRLWRRMLEAGGKRDSRLLALGGGSVCDLGGFVAGAFLRGIEHALLPTTLLAQVDAAIGGKTGVDLPGAKNSVGLFRHPALVIGDVGWLETLPRPERVAGLFEAVKAGFLLDTDLLARIEDDLEAILNARPEAAGPVVAAAAAAKIRVVEDDPEEAGPRRLLNFGHTLAHALEALAGYEGLRHGEAVGWGMLFAIRLSERKGLPAADAARLRELIARIGLPRLDLPDTPEILAAMARDKKAREDGLRWILAERVGEGRIVTVPADEVESELESWRRTSFGGDETARV